MIFRLGEFFSGAGGIALGAKNAFVKHKGKVFALEHAFAVDNNEHACKTYAHNICGGTEETVFSRSDSSIKSDVGWKFIR